ncbi:MAG: hypothetical protein AB1750_06665, partial [Chloroflexota bacterium]
MDPLVNDILALLGHIVSALGLGVFGFAAVRFALDSYRAANWQLQIALALGIFFLLVGVADFATPGSTGAFALGAGIAFFLSMSSKKAPEPEPKPKSEPSDT